MITQGRACQTAVVTAKGATRGSTALTIAQGSRLLLAIAMQSAPTRGRETDAMCSKTADGETIRKYLTSK